ncbi:MAG: YHS domain-containing protein [Burkholderiales bacterium]|nr:YHS domain-containing protein [Burkholderiales bacterium]
MSHSVVSRTQRRWLLALAAAGLLASAPALAAPPINTLGGGVISRRSDTAILGYDTVAYFTVGKPVKGQDRFATEWKGAKWKFASQSNLDLFKSDPEKYAPQYGGYCAYGVAQDNLVSIEPDKFSVREGKLYLNYNAEVQALWLKDPAGFIRQADAKFTALLKK